MIVLSRSSCPGFSFGALGAAVELLAGPSALALEDAGAGAGAVGSRVEDEA